MVGGNVIAAEISPGVPEPEVSGLVHTTFGLNGEARLMPHCIEREARDVLVFWMDDEGLRHETGHIDFTCANLTELVEYLFPEGMRGSG